MSQPISLEALKKMEEELQAAVAQYGISTKEVRQEEEILETEFVQAIEKEKIEDLKNTLAL